jgi:hypothetical protein
MKLKKFMQQAAQNPKIAQQLLNALNYDTGDGTSAIDMLKDDVADDAEYHDNISIDDLNNFLKQTE